MGTAKTFGLLAGLTMLALPCAALAHDMNNDYYSSSPASTNDYSGVGNSPTQNGQPRVAMEPDSASLPINGYALGTTYLVNPLDMTNTRDNRGDIPTSAAPQYRVYRQVNNAS